eukprot:scaffold3045_cov179-Ochromonas_danica.AAC.16
MEIPREHFAKNGVFERNRTGALGLGLGLGWACGVHHGPDVQMFRWGGLLYSQCDFVVHYIVMIPNKELLNWSELITEKIIVRGGQEIRPASGSSSLFIDIRGYRWLAHVGSSDIERSVQLNYYYLPAPRVKTLLPTSNWIRLVVGRLPQATGIEEQISSARSIT